MSMLATAPVSPAELEARLRLHRLPELGPARFKKLLEAFGSASKAISAPASAWRALGLPLACSEARRCAEIRDGASHALAWLERPGQHLLMWDQPDYPSLLAQISDAPPLLFVAGDPGILEKPQLAMVGSRRASRPGMDTAAAFSRSWPAPDLSLPAVWPWASMRPLIRRRWTLAGKRSACLARAKVLSTAQSTTGRRDDCHR
jgi:DNA processing protein